MRPFTLKVDPKMQEAIAAVARVAATVSGVFVVAVLTLLIGNSVQLAISKPLDSPALEALREAYRQAPTAEMAQQIRALDLMARKAWFTRQWQIQAAAILLLVGSAILVLSLRLLSSLAAALPRAPVGPVPDESRRKRGERLGIGVLGSLLLAGAIATGWWGSRALDAEQKLVEGSVAERAPGASALAAGRAAAPPAAGAGAAWTFDITRSDEYRSNWPQFRGPYGTAVAASQDPPVDWDGRTGKNILWSAEVPRPGFGSPIVWNDKVYLSGADDSVREVFCWSADTGALLWRTRIAPAQGPPAEGSPASPAPKVTQDTGYAASTLATNGSAVFAVFATGDVASLGADGKMLWVRSLGAPTHIYGYASSPACVGDLLIVQFDQEENGRLIAFEAATGRIRWETPRRVQASWASPVIVNAAEGSQILVNGNPYLAAYDAATGAELWQVTGMMGEIAPSPAFSDGRVFAGNQLLNLIAVEAATRKVLWEMFDDLPDVASPLAVQGMVVAAASFGVVTALDAATGTVLWKQEFPTGFYASPVFAGGRFYLLDRSGVMRILAAAREPKLLGSPSVGEPTDATPAFRGAKIYIRGTRHLFCIGARDG